MPETRLTRSEPDRMIAGVCGGLATYLGIDSALIRLAFFVLIFASGIGLPIYLILWLIMPSESGGVHKPNAAVMQDNIEEMSHKFSASMSRFGRTGTAGILLVLFGFYFLFEQFGWLAWLNGAFWPLLIIGAGVYMLVRRN